MEFSEINYKKDNGVATIAINRPKRYNAVDQVGANELIDAFTDAWIDTSIAVIVFTGEGDKAFCTGGDLSTRGSSGYKSVKVAFPLIEAWTRVTQLIRTTPKPVIARVNGFSIGGGQVWQMVCDLSIASDNAVFGQVGPRVGSFDIGFGTGDLVRTVGMKKAKEMWFMCKRYTAKEALEMGLVNAVVPFEQLDGEVEKWCNELLERSPMSLQMLKTSFQAESDGTDGITNLSIGALKMYYNTEEALEGRNSFMEKRKPDFNKFR